MKSLFRLYKSAILVAATSFCSLGLKAATWYVDNAAIGSSNAGTSWANALTNLASIKWANVQPGDDVQIAKGNYNPEALNVLKSGTPTAPITVHLAQDPHHNGHVYMANVTVGVQNWVTVSGSLSDSFAVPASTHQLMRITNNIGIHVSNGMNAGAYSSGGTSQRMLWFEIYDCGESNSGNVNGVQYNGSVKNSELGYIWIHDQIKGDGINIGSNPDPDWGDLNIHHCIVQNVGDDAMQIAGGGVDVSYCFIEKLTRGYAAGHPDATQTWGSYYRFHHNIFGDFQDPAAPGYASWGYNQFSTPVAGNFLFYDNLCINQYLNGSKGFSFTFDAWWSPNKYNSNVIVTNIFIANNLFCTPQMQPFSISLAFQSDASRGTNDSYTFTNCYFYNNTFVDCYNSQAGNANGVVFGIGSAGPTVDISYGSFPFNNNILKGINTKFGYVSPTIWSGIPAFASVAPFKANSSRQPLFRRYMAGSPPYDFHLSATDTVALNKGKNLSAFVGTVPMLDIDLDGNLRSAAGTWDIGPYQGVATTVGAPAAPKNLRLKP